MKMISEFNDGDHIQGQFLVGSVSKGTNNYGANYFSFELRDASGAITAKKWDATAVDESVLVVGNIIYLDGEVLKYKESLQVKAIAISSVDSESVDATKFMKAPPYPKEKLIEKFNELVDSIKNEDCQKIIQYFIQKFANNIFEYPAAASIHHEYSSGLLVHSTTMAAIANYLAPIYDADRDIVVTGCLLHDFGKMIELEGPAIFKYSLEGKLLGHISIMTAEIRNAAKELNITSEVPLLLEHMVLSHHGQLEFGSPVLPITKEALLLSLIDNLDSKMVITNKALEGVEEGEFSQKVFPLDGRSFYKPKK